MTLKFHITTAKRLKLKVRNFGGLDPMFVEVTGEKLVGGLFCSPTSKASCSKFYSTSEVLAAVLESDDEDLFVINISFMGLFC